MTKPIEPELNPAFASLLNAAFAMSRCSLLPLTVREPDEGDLNGADADLTDDGFADDDLPY